MKLIVQLGIYQTTMLILHLEDEGPLREIMNIALCSTDPNLNIQQFSDSDSAVNFIKENLKEITLYLLDVRVPGVLSGLEVASKVRELGSEKPIIITSAYRRPKKAQLELIDAQWMAKPWHIVEAPTKIISLAKQ